MDPLATLQDVKDRAPSSLTFTTPDEARIEKLLVDASAAFCSAAGGQRITRGTDTFRVRPTGRDWLVKLPQRPVVAINSVTDMQGNSVLYRWDGLELYVADLTGVVINATLPPSGCKRAPLDVSVTFGFDPVPDDVIGVVCNVTLRAFGVNPADGALTSEGVVGYSYSRGTIGAAGPVGLMPDERAIAAGYRLDASTTAVGLP